MTRTGFSVLLMMVLAFVLSACQTSRDPAAVAAADNYFISQVEVSRHAQFSTGLKQLGGESADALADAFSNDIRTKLMAELRPVMKGSRPARMEVVLNRVSVASEAGRVLLASNSHVDASVRIIDIESGKVVASRDIQATDRAKQAELNINGIPLGVFATAVVNLPTAATDRRIAAITNAFAKQVRWWVKPR